MDQDCDGANHGGTEEERALDGASLPSSPREYHVQTSGHLNAIASCVVCLSLSGMGDKLENADDMVEQEESSGSAPSPLFLGTKSKRLRSKVWDDFTPIYIDGKLARAECMHCHQVSTAAAPMALVGC